jgi:hypothetical protein
LKPENKLTSMWEDDDDNDDDNDYDPEEERRKLEALPIYQKAIEIYDLTKRIADTIESDKEHSPYIDMMMEDSMIVPAKIAGAEAMDDYILKMENAVVIKMHARSLLTQTAALRYLAALDEEYIQLLRNEIEEFRHLFKKWVQTFEIDTTKEGDGWGLFVPDIEE